MATLSEQGGERDPSVFRSPGTQERARKHLGQHTVPATSASETAEEVAVTVQPNKTLVFTCLHASVVLANAPSTGDRKLLPVVNTTCQVGGFSSGSQTYRHPYDICSENKHSNTTYHPCLPNRNFVEPFVLDVSQVVE